MNERMINFTNIGLRPHTGSVFRVFLALLFLLILTSCYATTDKLAVFARSVLSPQQVDALSGHYHIIQPDGGFASLAFTPRSEPWSYKQESPRFGSVPFFPQRPQRLAVADMSFKHVMRFDSGNVTTTHIDGVVVFSHIPGTDLILGGVPGETLQMRDEHGNMSPPAGEKNKTTNPFFILRQDGKTMTVKFFSQSDEGLKRAFPNIEFSSGFNSTPPLPTDRVLAYLKKHAAEAIDDDASIYLRSTQQQKELVVQKFNTAVSEEIERKKAEEMQAVQQADSEKLNFDVTVSAEAARSLREAIRKGDGETAAAGTFEGAKTAYNNKDYKRAFTLFESLAEQGDAKAQYYLGQMYRLGWGVSKNYVKAMKWYRKAAEQGHADAQANLASMYGVGQGVPKNHAKAAKWYRKAAEQGHAQAQLHLGDMYHHGLGVVKNIDEAERLFRLSAAQGNQLAQNELDDLLWDKRKSAPQKSSGNSNQARQQMRSLPSRRTRCDDGCITLCNKSEKTVHIATLHSKGGLVCALSGNGCSVEMEGWWRLKSGQCYQPNAALYWETYYSVVRISNGTRTYPTWSKDEALLNGDKSKGLSGYSGYSICVKKYDNFRRKIPGRPKSAFNETCPAGYEKSKVNLYTSGEVDYDLTYSIK